MKTAIGATVMAMAALAALTIPWTVLAGGGGAGRGGGTCWMGRESIRNQTRMENRFQTRDGEQLRMRDGTGEQYRDRIRKESGTGSAVKAAGEKAKKGNAYGPGDGTGPYLPMDGTGYGAPANR